MHKIIKSVVFCACALFGMSAVAQEIEGGNSTAADAIVQPAEGAAAGAEAAASSDTTATEGELAGDAQVAETTDNGDTAGNNEDKDALTEAALDKQLHDVSVNLDTLKEDTFTTKSRLLLLREEILQRSVTGSHLLIHHQDDIGGQYELVQIYYAIDRNPVYMKQDDDGIKLNEEDVVYDEIIAPGAHQISVLYIFKGKKWGIFTYMSDYTFRVESGYDFIVDEGKAAELTIVASEQGDAFTAYEDRPTITYNYHQDDYDFLKNIPSADEADVATTANTKSDK